MNKKTIIYSLVGLLTSSTLVGLLITSRTQAQSSNPNLTSIILENQPPHPKAA